MEVGRRDTDAMKLDVGKRSDRKDDVRSLRSGALFLASNSKVSKGSKKVYFNLIFPILSFLFISCSSSPHIVQ